MSESELGAQGAKEVFHSVRLLAAIFVSSICLSGISAQGNSANTHGKESVRAAQMRALNNSVLQLHGQMKENASSAAAIRGQAATVLAQRAAALQTLMQEDPHAAVTFAFAPDLLADLAEKFPGSAASLEAHVTLSGIVEHWIADSADMKSSKESWFLNAADSQLELHFATPQRPGAKSGPVVTIEGVQLGSQVAVTRLSSTPRSSFFVIPRGTFFLRNFFSFWVLMLAAIAFAFARSLRAGVTNRTTPVLS